MIEVIVLIAERQSLASLEEAVDQEFLRVYCDLVFTTVAPLIFVDCAVVVGVEDARITALAQQNQRVRQRFEPTFDLGLEGLQWLRVVVVDQRHRQCRMPGHERTVKNLAQVVTVTGFAGIVKVFMQRRVEQRHAPVGRPNKMLERPEFVRPVLADREEILARPGADRIQPILEELVIDVLDRIEAKAVDIGQLDEPLAPILEFAAHFGVVNIDIAAHQVIVIAFFVVDIAVETLVFENVHRFKVRVVGVLTNAVEVIPMPLHRRVFSSPAWEVELRPNLDFAWLANFFKAVVWAERCRQRGLLRVATHAVIEDRIGVNSHASGGRRAARLEELVFRAVLGSDRSFLVEFTQVKQVVNTVSNVVPAARAFVRRWQPQRGHAALGKLVYILCNLLPQRAVARRVPMKKLHHDAVQFSHTCPLEPYVQPSRHSIHAVRQRVLMMRLSQGSARVQSAGEIAPNAQSCSRSVLKCSTTAPSRCDPSRAFHV